MRRRQGTFRRQEHSEVPDPVECAAARLDGAAATVDFGAPRKARGVAGASPPSSSIGPVSCRFQPEVRCPARAGARRLIGHIQTRGRARCRPGLPRTRRRRDARARCATGASARARGDDRDRPDPCEHVANARPPSGGRESAFQPPGSELRRGRFRIPGSDPDSRHPGVNGVSAISRNVSSLRSTRSALISPRSKLWDSGLTRRRPRRATAN